MGVDYIVCSIACQAPPSKKSYQEIVLPFAMERAQDGMRTTQGGAEGIQRITRFENSGEGASSCHQGCSALML
jgi:hypothetical protein